MKFNLRAKERQTNFKQHCKKGAKRMKVLESCAKPYCKILTMKCMKGYEDWDAGADRLSSIVLKPFIGSFLCGLLLVDFTTAGTPLFGCAELPVFRYQHQARETVSPKSVCGWASVMRRVTRSPMAMPG